MTELWTCSLIILQMTRSINPYLVIKNITMTNIRVSSSVMFRLTKKLMSGFGNGLEKCWNEGDGSGAPCRGSCPPFY